MSDAPKPAAQPANAKSARRGLEGYMPTLTNEAEYADAVEKAVDFRGDITMRLKGGEEIQGFVFNKVEDGETRYLEIYPRNEDAGRQISYADIEAMVFSQVDPSVGRSWEEWTRKWEEKKKADAEGRDIGNIEPEAMSLEDVD